MTRRDLTRLFIKVFGLLVLFGALDNLPTAVIGSLLRCKFGKRQGSHTWSTAVMVGVSHFGSDHRLRRSRPAVLLWWSGRIVDGASHAPDDGDLPVATADLRNVEVSLVTVIGLYFLVDGIAELCRWIFSQGLNYGLDRVPTPVPFWTRLNQWEVRWEIPWIGQALVKLLIGLWLVLGRGSAVAILRQSRHWVRKWRAWPYEPV